MLRIDDRVAGERVQFNYANQRTDLHEVMRFLDASRSLAIDTEATGINCYATGWKLRTVQFGNATKSYVVPARFRDFIARAMEADISWIGHNGPHDIRAIDQHLGYETGVVCKGETYIPSHHLDSRNRDEGGVGHGLKELAIAYVDREAGKWEVALKKEFKTIAIPMPGMAYKSGPRKGQQRYRKAKLSEGWGLIDPENPIYIAYAAADPILTYRLWQWEQPIVRENHKLYQFDHKVQLIADRLARRAMALDAQYTEQLSSAYHQRAMGFMSEAGRYGCANVHSARQVAETLLQLGVRLRERTPTGQFKTDGTILRDLLSTVDATAAGFIHCVLGAKQLLKRRESYTDAMLREMDVHGRVHPSINTLGARTTRMSVSGPPLQQLPTKDREDEE